MDAGERGWVAEALCRNTDPRPTLCAGGRAAPSRVDLSPLPCDEGMRGGRSDNKVEFGVWGGMTERQRRALLKEHPEVVSWSEFLNKRRARSTG